MTNILIEIFVGAVLVATIIVGKSKSAISPLRVCLSSFLIGAVSLFVSIAFLMEMVLVQSVLTFFIVGLLAACDARRSVIVAATLLSAFIGLGVSLKTQHDQVQNVLDLRAEYPFASLADRLAYEPQVPQESQSSVIELSQPATAWLTKFEENLPQETRMGMRQHILQQLHDDRYIAFVKSAGFGMMRMSRPSRWSLEIPASKPESLPNRPEQIDPPTAIQNPILAASEDADATPQLTELHNVGRNSFLNSDRIGFVKSRQLAAGFEPHAILANPNSGWRIGLDAWQISRLDLVSLLKFAEPRVYLSEHLPRMDELRNAKTRPADEFEQRALAQLREGEDIVLDQQLNTIRMVGAVRAAKQCLDCHSVRRGELLGAFSYLLDRKQPIAPPKVEDKPVSMIRRLFHAS